MRRGNIWTGSGGNDYAKKPRPFVILQDDGFQETASITVCPLTTDPTDAHLFRLKVEPTDRNGLRETSRIMVDKITSIPKSKLGICIGRLEDEAISRLNRSVIVFLGLAASPRPQRQR
jgi:mRNA interferase MazF